MRFPTIIRKCPKMVSSDIRLRIKMECQSVFKPKLKPKDVLLNRLPDEVRAHPAPLHELVAELAAYHAVLVPRRRRRKQRIAALSRLL